MATLAGGKLYCGFFDGGSRFHCAYGSLYVFLGIDGDWWTVRLNAAADVQMLLIEAERLEG